MKTTKSQKAIYIIISVLIAVVFWLYVDNTGTNERDIRLSNVPITFVGEEDELADRGLMLVSGDDTTIDLRLRGRRQVISRINRNNIRIEVDVSNIVSTGSHTLNYTIIYPNNVSASSVTVVSASLYTVTVEVGELHSKTIDIVTDINGSVAEGYMLHECTVTPETLVISGTEEDIAAVDHALVKVSLHNATTSYSEYLSYTLVDEQGTAIDNPRLRCSEDKVRVEIPVVTLKEVPISVDFIESGGSRKENISYTISPETITISGEESTLNEIESIALDPIDLSQVMGDDTLEFEVSIPGGCTNESGTNTVEVAISFLDMQTATYECSNISFVNAPSGYTPTAVTQSLSVTLRGKEEDLQNITAQNIRIVVDLSDMSSASGTYTAKARVYVDGSEDVGAIGTYQVGYRLQRG